jgi:hypothetical protein
MERSKYGFAQLRKWIYFGLVNDAILDFAVGMI